jgi:predicted transcriptional regulator
MNTKTKRGNQRPGMIERSIRVDEGMYRRFSQLAKRRGVSVQRLIEQSMLAVLAEETAHQIEQTLLPEIDRVLQDRHKRLEAGLRTMMARVGYEVLRTQYIWLNFLTEAGVSPGKVETWREQGWNYAVKEFKRQPKPEMDDD